MNNNNKGEGGGLNQLSSSEKGGLIRGGTYLRRWEGGLNRGFTV